MGTIKLTLRYSVIFLVLLGLASLIIFRSLFKTIAAGLILGYIFYPLYSLFYALIKRKNLAALLLTILVLIILVVPTFFVANKLRSEVSVAFVVAKQYLEGGAKSINCQGSGLCQLIPKNLRDASPQTKALLTNSLGKGTEFIVNKTTQAIVSLPGIVLDLFIVFFIVYYTFKDGKTLLEKAKNVIPLPKQKQMAIIGQFTSVT